MLLVRFHHLNTLLGRLLRENGPIVLLVRVGLLGMSVWIRYGLFSELE